VQVGVLQANRDTLSVDYRKVIVTAPQTFALTGADGHVAFHLGLHDVMVEAPFAVSLGQSAGSESTDGIITILDEQLGGTPVPLDGTLTMTDHGGPFRDDIRVIYDFNPQPEPPGRPQDLQGAVELHVPQGDPWSVMFELTPPSEVT
jgi:hypothetical protein